VNVLLMMGSFNCELLNYELFVQLLVIRITNEYIIVGNLYWMHY